MAIYAYASTSVYASGELYGNPEAAGRLPRQPYTYNWDPQFLIARAREFNDWFYGALAEPSSYPDPALGEIETSPPWEDRACVPVLPWKAGGDSADCPPALSRRLTSIAFRRH